MIITDVEQIDRIAEETFGATKGIVSVDMKDYAFVKEHSESLKAIKVDIIEISKSYVFAFEEALKEVCTGNVCNLLIYISGNGINSGVKTITVEQMQFFHSSIEKNVSEDTCIIWGVGESCSTNEGLTILIIAGNHK